MLPVLFVNRGEDLVFGSTDSGSVQICDIEAIVTQSLVHEGESYYYRTRASTQKLNFIRETVRAGFGT